MLYKNVANVANQAALESKKCNDNVNNIKTNLNDAAKAAISAAYVVSAKIQIKDLNNEDKNMVTNAVKTNEKIFAELYNKYQIAVPTSNNQNIELIYYIASLVNAIQDSITNYNNYNNTNETKYKNNGDNNINNVKRIIEEVYKIINQNNKGQINNTYDFRHRLSNEIDTSTQIFKNSQEILNNINKINVDVSNNEIVAKIDLTYASTQDFKNRFNTIKTNLDKAVGLAKDTETFITKIKNNATSLKEKGDSFLSQLNNTFKGGTKTKKKYVNHKNTYKKRKKINNLIKTKKNKQ
jgi:hypothetical protein